MDDMQSKKTSSVDATIADFITIHDLLKDSNRYFQNRIETKTNSTTYEDFDHLEYLYERTTDVLRLINEIIEKSKKEPSNTTFEHTANISESEENTSYLDMSMRKYESYDLKKSTGNLNRNDYVDVSSKASKECNDDDNIYDNYMVERNGKCSTVKDTVSSQNVDISTKNDVNEKKDCPFNGLPAAHLMIMQSPKVGWLSMHLRRKRFIRHFSINFKRKYYTGLVSRKTDKDYYEWWLLMYAGGTSDLKPTVCLPLNQFEACADRSKATRNDEKQQQQQNECTGNPCKFELNEKSKKKDAKSYCFVAETPEHCEHWINLVKQLSIGLPYIESTFTTTAQIRKLPMPPLNVKNIDRLTDDIDTVDTNAISSARANIELEHNVDICNYSEGVYEEPEEYYKNVPASTKTTTTTTTVTGKMPKLPVKKTLSQSTASTIRMDDISAIYDTPKKPVRKSDDVKHYDLISVQKDNCNEPKTVDSLHESSRLKIDDEIRSKLSTQLKEQSEKYLSSSSPSSSPGRKTNDEEMGRNSTTDGTPNKYQLSAMRKWLFSNHLAKLRQSTNTSNFMRKSSGSNTSDTTSTQQQQQQQQQQKQQQQPSSQQLNKTNAIAPSSDALKRSFSVQPKGTKVHMIINQLEANGQLTLLSGGGTSTPSKCTALMSA